MKSIEASASPPTGRVAVWDLPTRLFHWSLVALIALSWWSAEEGHTSLHMWSGYGVITLLLFRLMWGLVGSSTARFSSFVKGPRAVAAYVREVGAWKGTGHNPLGALSVLALLATVAVQVTTGLVQTDDDGLVEGPLAPLVSFETAEAAREIHELTFNILLAMIALHLAAILFYRLALGRRLVGPMISGLARADSAVEPMRPARWWIALVCLAMAAAVTGWAIAGAPPLGP